LLETAQRLTCVCGPADAGGHPQTGLRRDALDAQAEVEGRLL